MSKVAQALQQSIHLHKTGDLQKARKGYEDIVRIDGRHAEALHLLGVVALQEGRSADAVQWINRAIQQRPRSASFHNNLGTAYRNTGDRDQARASFREAVRLDPKYAGAFYNLGLELTESAPEEAVECLRRAIRLDPQFAGAHDALGTLLLTLGDSERAVASLSRAVAAEPASSEFAFNLANAHSACGNREAAERELRRAAALSPKSPEVHNNLGALLKEQDKFEDAMQALKHALSLRPTYFEAWMNLGRTYLLIENYQGARDTFSEALHVCGTEPRLLGGLGKAHHHLAKYDEAIACFQEAIALDPEAPDAYFDLGMVYLERGDWETAAEVYERGLQLRPDHSSAWETLGGAYMHQQMLEQAARCYEQALKDRPEDSGLLLRLADAQRLAGQFDLAEPNYERLLAIDPNSADGWNNFGNLYTAQDRSQEAAAYYERAIQADPEFATAYCNLGATVSNLGNLERARELFQKSLEIRPNDRVRIQNALSLPPVYRDLQNLQEERQRLTDEVAKLIAAGVELDPAKQLCPNEFYLGYQGYNDRDLLEQIGSLFRSSHEPNWNTRPSGERIHVGFISRNFRDHTIAIFMMGLMARLPRDIFHVTILSPVPHDDTLGQRIRHSADRYAVLTDDIPTAVRRASELKLDLLFFTDIGMDPYSYTLANSRLAPVQCVTWGHPITTGLDTIDYFVSSDLIEIPDADEHYTEQLVRLKTLPSYYHKPVAPELLKQRHHFGFPERGSLYLCPQSVFKLHPEFDAILAGILQRDPTGHIVLIDGHFPKWTELLKERFRHALGGDFERLHFLTRMGTPDFHNVLAICDVMLDPLHFGGGSTNYEAMAFGIPVVTLPSSFLRGRGAVGLYRKMDLMDCVVGSLEEYINLAVQLATDAEYNRTMRRRIRDASWCLFEDIAAVEQISEFLIDAVERSRRSSPPSDTREEAAV